jgi:hypothetical protein
MPQDMSTEYFHLVYNGSHMLIECIMKTIINNEEVADSNNPLVLGLALSPLYV